MKKILFMAIYTLSIANINAQHILDYNDYIHWMDSLKTEYSVKKFVHVSQINYNYESNFGNLSANEQNLLIDKAEYLYHQQEYTGLYCLAGFYLNRFYSFSKEPQIKERLIEIFYDNICSMSSRIISFGESKYYTQKTKNRLLEIAEKRWREKDLKAWTVFIKQNLNINSYKSGMKKIIKETNRQGENIENYLLDSLINKGIEKNLQTNMNRPVNKWCVMMIGSLNDQRFVPALENMLEEYKDRKDYPEIQEACTYALAKLGVQKYLDEIYSSDYVPYRYLGTKEAFLKQLDKEFVWNKGGSIFTNQKARPMSLVALESAMMFGYGYLENIPEEIEKEVYSLYDFVIPKDIGSYDPNTDEQNKELIKKAYRLYNWLKENQDIWQMPPAQDTF